ncbi:MAG: SDR family NAD(P)-dependent oxidoreductase [Chloroflexi bacterium]|nr:SDR family NAD(P)-dependent oxidoreductase [Chloroflexota bacterium]
MQELSDRVAIVAGVGNLGLALARRFAEEGMRVVLADIDEQVLASAEAELRAVGASCLAVPTDVGKLAAMEALAERTLEEFGAVHVICNNVGVNPRSANLWEASDADWRWTLDANLWGMVHAVRVFVPIMLAAGDEGHIVNTSTVPGLGGRRGNSTYVVSKGAIVTLTEVLHHELTSAGARVRASLLLPGRIAGGIARSERPAEYREPGDEERLRLERERYEARIRDRQAEPDDEYRTPEEIAELVCTAIREERFYVLTQPAKAVAQVRRRTEAIASGGEPVLFSG